MRRRDAEPVHLRENRRMSLVHLRRQVYPDVDQPCPVVGVHEVGGTYRISRARIIGSNLQVRQRDIETEIGIER